MRLKEEDLVARGKQRSVYKFPNNEQLLIKLAEHDDGHGSQPRHRELLRRYFPSVRYRHIFCEIEHEATIKIRATQKGMRSPIAATRGVVKANNVIGLIVEQISLKNGAMGPTLHELIAEKNFDDKALSALNEFAQSFFTLGVIAGDVHSKNIVWGDYNGEFVPFLVDGYGDRNFVPLKTYITWFKYRKLHKCFKHLAPQFGCHWVRSERVFKKIED